MASPITDHVAQALARLLEQSRGRPVMTGVLTALVGAVQQMEDQVAPLAAGTSLFGGAAVGLQLDHLGELVGLPRGGLTDAQYALLIQGKVGQNNSDATTATLETLATTCFGASGATVNAALTPGHAHLAAPCVVGVEVGVPTIDPSLYPLAITILRGAVAVGVALSWVTTHAGADAFALAGTASGTGLGDVAVADSGGQLADLVTASTAA